MADDSLEELLFSRDYVSELPFEMRNGAHIRFFDKDELREYIQYQNLLDAVMVLGLLIAMALLALQ